MSDVAEGVGWWVASDGRWYPPELHPVVNRVPPRPVPSLYPTFSDPLSPSLLPEVEPRRGRGTLYAALAIVVVLVLVGVGSVFGGSKDTPVSSPVSPANSLIRSSIIDSDSQSTAHMQFAFTMTHTNPYSEIGENGSGDVSLNGSREKFSVNVSTAPGGAPQQFDIIVLRGRYYQTTGTSGSWQSQPIPSGPGLGGSPTNMVQLLKSGQGYTTVLTKEGVVNGVMARSYAVVFNPTAVQSQLGVIGLSAQQQAQARADVKTIQVKMTVDIGVSTQDLLRVSMSMSYGTAGSGMQVQSTESFSSYGEPLNITAPA